MKKETERELLVIEITKCTKDYSENRCSPSERVKALEDYCNEKDKCMSRDPSNVNKSLNVMAKLLAEIINDFFEPLTYKTISLVVVALLVLVLFSECVVGRSRRAINGLSKK